MTSDQADRIKAAERTRISSALRSYFESGAGTYRTLIAALGVDYRTGMDEGWLELSNAIAEHDEKVARGDRLS